MSPPSGPLTEAEGGTSSRSCRSVHRGESKSVDRNVQHQMHDMLLIWQLLVSNAIYKAKLFRQANQPGMS